MKIALSGSYVALLRKKRVKLSREVVHKLKKVSRLSYINQWEYAGKIESDTLFYVTSKKRNTVEYKEINEVWYSTIGFHTHPGLGIDEGDTKDDTSIFTTLPSSADFQAFIKGFPQMQANIVCDARGYYVIDIMKSVDHKALPLPEAVDKYMYIMRHTPFMCKHRFSEDGFEYYHTTLESWKRYINSEVHRDLMHQFGISIRYYGYNDEPPVVTVYEV